MAGLCFSIILGLSFIFTKKGLEVLQPYHLLAFPFATGVMFLNSLWLLGLIKKIFKGKNIRALLILSLFQPVNYFICEITGVSKTKASEAGMVIALISVMVAILSTLFKKEPPTLLQWFFTGFSFLVIVFFMMNFMLSKVEASRSAVFANLVTIVSIKAGVILLSDPFYWYHFVGSVFIVAGVLETNYYRSKRYKKASG